MSPWVLSSIHIQRGGPTVAQPGALGVAPGGGGVGSEQPTRPVLHDQDRGALVAHLQTTVFYMIIR
jgi:hypothetical protein